MFKNFTSGTPQPPKLLEKIGALLDRLEAAEEFGEMMCLTYGNDAEKTILYEAWRKASGK